MLRRWVVVLLCGLLAGMVVAPSPALAHGTLAASTPANGATLADPLAAVSLTFTEKPAQFAYFTVTAPGGARVDAGWSHGEPAPLAKPVREYQVKDGVWVPQLYNTGYPVQLKVSHWPAAGAYVVRYQTVASDGDEVKGEVKFTYSGAATPATPGWQTPTDQPKPELAAAVGRSAPGASPSAEPPAQFQAQAPVEPATSMWVWLVPVLLIAAAVLCFFIVRPPRRRS